MVDEGSGPGWKRELEVVILEDELERMRKILKINLYIGTDCCKSLSGGLREWNDQLGLHLDTLVCIYFNIIAFMVFNWSNFIVPNARIVLNLLKWSIYYILRTF